MINQRFCFFAPCARGLVALVVFRASRVGVLPDHFLKQFSESRLPAIAREMVSHATANKAARVNPRGRLSWFCIHDSFAAPWVARP